MSITKIFYLRDNGNNPFACIAVEADDATLRTSFSLCHRRDRFNKDLARKIALGRLNDRKNAVVAPIFGAVDTDNLRAMAFKLLSKQPCDRIRRGIRAQHRQDALKAMEDATAG
jgi:hypothetical protein